jgi:hypothetical protein
MPDVAARALRTWSGMFLITTVGVRLDGVSLEK